MSNIQQIENLKQIVVQSQVDFEKLAKTNGVALDYKKEASFAIQVLSDNAYLQGIALKNKDSLKWAVLNVASIGLSLNPVQRLAYLVPRKDKVCLDISYLGLVKLATDSGAVKLVQVGLVYAKDKFKIRGLGKEPMHEFDPFMKDRGEFKGAYCVAKTHDGEFLVDFMTADEIHSIRARSESFKKNSGPWVTDYTEMVKKTVIKRAYKLWPKTDSRAKFENAIDVSNNADPVDLNASPLELSNESAEIKTSGLEKIRDSLVLLERTEEKYIAHLNTALARKIESLNDLTEIEINQQVSLLNDMVEKKKAKEAPTQEAIEQMKQDFIKKMNGEANENNNS